MKGVLIVLERVEHEMIASVSVSAASRRACDMMMREGSLS
jgi:hypothetical protein